MRKKSAQATTVRDFLSVLSAIHLSSYVDSPFKDRGGLWLVGPPGSLKTTCVDFLDDNFSDALVLSDVNVQTLTKMKDRISGGAIRTLVFSEWQKIYDRHPSVSSGIEGTIRAFAAEGFTAASFEDASISRVKAEATIIGAMTNATREKRSSGWEESGFSRRFLWSLMKLKDPHALERAVVKGELIEIAQGESPRPPVSGSIPNWTTIEERRQIAHWCKYQPSPHNSQVALLVKAWAVMKWWARTQRRSETNAFKSLARFAKSLGREGVAVEVA